MSDWKDLFAEQPAGALLRRRVALAGHVLDALSKAPIAGAVVRLVDGPPAFRQLCERLAALRAANPGWQPRGDPPDRRVCRGNGSFVFTDLAAGGEYRLRVAAPQLGSRYGSIELVVTPPDYRLGLELPPTCISGTVRDANSGEALAGVRIALVGGDALAWTNSAGQYALGPITSGTWTVVMSRTGYASQRHTGQTVAPGQQLQLDSELQLKSNNS